MPCAGGREPELEVAVAGGLERGEELLELALAGSAPSAPLLGRGAPFRACRCRPLARPLAALVDLVSDSHRCPLVRVGPGPSRRGTRYCARNSRRKLHCRVCRRVIQS